ncbi:hypothetical protein OIO90_000782 [Microbotryomycetes sp. JL221]|nr:hypothetical protein OIO90_000782 [Microbotryomycetes sp. JL221]
MRSSIAPLALIFATVGVLVAPASVLAQSSTESALPPDASTLPGCAITCTLSSLPGTACAQYGVSNTTCICTDQQFQLSFYECQSQTCSQEELQQALAFGASTCEANGTPINTAAVPSGFSSGAAPSASASASASGSGSASRSMSMSGGMSSATGAAGSGSAVPTGTGASGSAPSASAPPSAAGTLELNSGIFAVGVAVAALAGGVRLLF